MENNPKTAYYEGYKAGMDDYVLGARGLTKVTDVTLVYARDFNEGYEQAWKDAKVVPREG